MFLFVVYFGTCSELKDNTVPRSLEFLVFVMTVRTELFMLDENTLNTKSTNP